MGLMRKLLAKKEIKGSIKYLYRYIFTCAEALRKLAFEA